MKKPTNEKAKPVNPKTKPKEAENSPASGAKPAEPKRSICGPIAELLRRTASAIVISGACLFLAAVAAPPAERPADYQPPVPGSYTLPVIKLAADGALLDATGQPVRLQDLTRGRVTVLSFIYTRCAAANACPYATGVLNELHEMSDTDRELAAGLRLVSMSFDPEHDTPARLADYSAGARERKHAAEWAFVTAPTRAELEPILIAYDQAVDRKADPADPQGPLHHTLRVYLVDPRGQIRNIYSSGTLDVRLVLADIRTLLLEGAKVSQR